MLNTLSYLFNITLNLSVISLGTQTGHKMSQQSLLSVNLRTKWSQKSQLVLTSCYCIIKCYKQLCSNMQLQVMQRVYKCGFDHQLDLLDKGKLVYMLGKVMSSNLLLNIQTGEKIKEKNNKVSK